MDNWEGCDIGRHRTEATPPGRNIAWLVVLAVTGGLVIGGYASLLVAVFG